jgi:transcriptional regulator with XRE-family HTH domain
MLITLGANEAEGAGRLAEDLFVRQMRRRRAALDLSQAELADRVENLGGSLYQQTIAKIESGQRAVRLTEAALIAEALGSSVSEMLSKAIGDPESSLEKIDIEGLLAQVHAAQRHRNEMSEKLRDARDREAQARDQAAIAQQAVALASMEVRRIAAQQQDADDELNHLIRISIERQSELNAKYGPGWRQKMSILPPITLKMILEGQKEHLQKLRDLADTATDMSAEQRHVLLAEIEALSGRLESSEDGEE